MRLKKRKENRKERVTARVTSREFNEIKLKAGLYCEGNISEWIATAALKYKPNRNDVD